MIEVEELECDDCGSLNPAHAKSCSLCGASLSEELERAKAGPTWLFACATLGVTALCVGTPGFLLYAWLVVYQEITMPLWAFLPAYALIWGVLGVVSRSYMPKQDYDFGYSLGSMGWMNKPLTFRDDVDRMHASLGFVLFPVNLVVGMWGALLWRLKEGR